MRYDASFALLQCFIRRRHVCYPVDDDTEEDGTQADHSASPVLKTTSSRHLLSKGKMYGLEKKFLLSKTGVSLLGRL